MLPLLGIQVFKINIKVYKRDIDSNIANMEDHSTIIHQRADQMDKKSPKT